MNGVSRQEWGPLFFNALPVLGKDGTLWDVQRESPAAGSVHAKTGTFSTSNALSGNLLIAGKGLAGYLVRRDGKKLAIAIYANFVPADRATGTHLVGDALGEIAS